MLSRSLRLSISALALSAVGNSFAATGVTPRNVLLYQIPSGLKVADSPGPGTGNPGTGTPGKTAAKLLVPATFSFGNVPLNQPTTRVLSLVVAGDEGSVSFTGGMNFSANGIMAVWTESNCRGTLNPGDECDIEFVANPDTLGYREGTLQFSTKEGGQHSVKVSASGASAVTVDLSKMPKAKVGETYTFSLRDALVALPEVGLTDQTVVRYLKRGGAPEVGVNPNLGLFNFLATAEQKAAGGVDANIRLTILGKTYDVAVHVDFE